MVAMSGADLIHLAAGMLDSGNSISYEQYVIDNEIIGMICKILSGIRVSKETLASDVIEEIGPGGNYVLADHTVEHMMDEFFYPDLAVRCNFDIWEERGRPNMMSRAKERVEKILKEDMNGLLDPELISEIKVRFPGIHNI
jgi:trimethylamine--corrinoid protein Co-methyltransferase